LSDTTEGTLLGGRVKYRQFVAGHRSGFEPVLLAASLDLRPGARVLEVGTGAGAALLCLAARVEGVSGVGAEIDLALAALANINIKDNGLEGFFAVCADVERLPFGKEFDAVMANPPWYDPAGTVSPDRKKALARFAAPALRVWVTAMAAVLKPRGKLHLIIPASSLPAAMTALQAEGCGDFSIFPLWPRAGAEATQVIIVARRWGGPKNRLLAGLVLHEGDKISPAAEAVLRAGGALMGFK
jgi:tRNA1Val (adenine37-N6)-methyltransferase